MWAKIRAGAWEIVKFVVVTLAIVLPIRVFIAQPFIVSGGSMEPTFHSGEYLIIDELSYFFRPPARGEVIVFRFPKEPSTHFIKRVIGLPGETVIINQGEVTIEHGGVSEKLKEPYISQAFPTDLRLTLLPDEYFVLGDNRPVSLDSRFWGVLPRRLITGRAFLRLWPAPRLAYLPGEMLNY